MVTTTSGSLRIVPRRAMAVILSDRSGLVLPEPTRFETLAQLYGATGRHIAIGKLLRARDEAVQPSANMPAAGFRDDRAVR